MISNPEINALKHRIRELEGIIAHHKTRIEERLRILEETEGTHYDDDVCVWVNDTERDFRKNELRWVLEDL
jgi:hypothetical protein